MKLSEVLERLFLKSSERKELAGLRSRALMREAEGKSPKSNIKGDQETISRRAFMRAGLVGTAATIATPVLVSLINDLRLDEFDKLERFITADNLEELNSEQLDQFVKKLLSVFAKKIPFYRKALEMVEKKNYKFTKYSEDTASKRIRDYHHKSGPFDGITDEVDNIVYFNFDQMQEFERQRRIPFSRNFIGVLSDELVHVIYESTTSKNAGDEIVRSISQDFYILGRGSKEERDRLGEALTKAEMMQVNRIRDEALSTVMSRIFFNSDPKVPIEKLMYNSKVNQKFISAIDSYIREAWVEKYGLFENVYKSNPDKGPAILRTLKPGLEISRQRVAQQYIENHKLRDTILKELEELGVITKD